MIIPVATNASQGLRLAACNVNLNTADMWLAEDNGKNMYFCKESITPDWPSLMPAWTLSALTEILPYKVRINGKDYTLSIERSSSRWAFTYVHVNIDNGDISTRVDAYAEDLLECVVRGIEALHGWGIGLDYEDYNKRITHQIS